MRRGDFFFDSLFCSNFDHPAVFDDRGFFPRPVTEATPSIFSEVVTMGHSFLEITSQLRRTPRILGPSLYPCFDPQPKPDSS